MVVAKNILKVRPFPACLLQQFIPWQYPWVRKEPGGCSQLQGGPINNYEQYNAEYIGMPDVT